MKRCFNAVIAATLAASLAVPVPAAFADEAGDDTASGAAQAAATAEGDTGNTGEGQAASDQVSPLLVTEVVTDSPGKGKYTYVEVYNNSDNPINFKDYVYYYCYEGGMGTGKVFSSSDKHLGIDYGSKDADVIIEPGKTLVLWMGGAKNETSLADFNKTYGTSLVEGKDIIRTPYAGIHTTNKRGYFFGKDSDAVMIGAWSNANGDEIPAGNPNKQGIQYTYPGSGRECVDNGLAKATPGSVSADQIPAQRANASDQQAKIEKATATGDGQFKVTVEVPYQGSSATTFVNLHYKQHYGDKASDEKTIALEPTGDGKTFTGAIDSSELFGESVEWYVTAYGNTGNEVRTDAQTTPITAQVPVAEKAAPYYITEVHANPQSTDGKQYSYFEVYNASDKPINLSYFKIFYYYNYPDQTASASGKVWSLDDFTAYLEPGKTMVYYLSSNGTTVEDFNNFYGTSLEEGKDIVRVNYAGLHSSEARWIRFGTTEDDAFTVAGFNENASERSDHDTSLQYTYPRGTGDREPVGTGGLTATNASLPVEVSAATPGEVADWQKSPVTAKFQGYPGYPEDDGQAPTLAENTQDIYTVPESIDEGDALKVLYDTDLLVGATSDARRDAFTDNKDNASGADNPTNYPGGAEALKTRPYLLGTEVLYKLDDDSDWTVVKQKTQWRLGHFMMQIPSDVLFGHDKVTYKVRAYSLYGMSETDEKTVKINRLNATDGMRLSLKDGAVVSGTTTVTANDGSDNAKTTISVDGAQVTDARKTFENGAWFMVQTSGMDSYFKDAITAPYGDNPRDIITIMGPWCETPTSRAVHIDNKYFTYNAEKDTYNVTLTLWAGDSGTPFEEALYPSVFGENHEDYKVSGLQMKLANGKSYLPVSIAPDNEKTNTSTALDVWHTIGDSAGMETHLDATFEIPAADATAMGFDWDTTQVADGAHAVTAQGENGTASANVIVDNTKPTVDLGIEDGKPLYQAVTLDPSAIASDANGLKSVAATLDGEDLALPSAIDPQKLAVGEHVLAAVAVDEAGNTTTSQVKFTVEDNDPDVTVDSDGDGITATTANLTVNVGDDPANVSFRQGRTLSADDIVAASTNQTATDDGSFPAQLFEAKVGTAAGGDILSLSWKGQASSVDDAHPVTMYAYNFATQGWEKVATADANGEMTGEFPAADHLRDGNAVILVQQVATEGYPTAALPDESVFTEAVSLQSLDGAGEAVQSSWDGTGLPESYDFSFAWETDTQYYAESFPYHFDNMNQWIVDNAQRLGIRYVMHTGDIVDDVDMGGEWVNADHSMKILDDAGIPNGVLAGNHDVYAGMEGYGNYWKYFGEDRYSGNPWYGGSYKNNLGHYDLLSENGQDFLVLYMSWDIYTDEINWMNQVLAQYPDRKAIICLHRYANVKETNAGLLDYTGKLLQEEVVAKNPNVFAVLNGHYHGSSIQTSAFDDNGDGVNERTVYQICTDYQSDPEGGSEYLKFLYFDLKNNKIYVNSYSPYRDDFNYYDTAKQSSYAAGTQYTSQDIMELDVPFTKSADDLKKSLTTSAISASVESATEIGAAAGSGDVSFTWKGLTPSTKYGWYAVVTNDKGGVTRTAVQEFTTEAAAEPAVPTFTDVDYSLWYGPAVTFVAGKGLMTGYTGTTLFGVGDTLTRGQLATILWRNACPNEAASYDATKAKDETGIAGSADGMYYTAAANWAVKKGVMTGFIRDDGSADFAADENVTFEQLVTVLARLTAKSGDIDAAGDNLSKFVDGSSVADWAKKYVNWAAGEGLVKGYDTDAGQVLLPGEDVARERTAMVLQRAFALGLLSSLYLD